MNLHYRVFKSPQRNLVLDQSSSFLTLAPYFFQIRFNIILIGHVAELLGCSTSDRMGFRLTPATK
jgi:hypothetical protein